MVLDDEVSSLDHEDPGSEQAGGNEQDAGIEPSDGGQRQAQGSDQGTHLALLVHGGNISTKHRQHA